jgi:DNA-binding Xre family transcriptional regulator
MITILLKEVAEAKGRKMYHVQKQTGLDIGLIRRYWRNETTSVDLRYLDRLCAYLGVTPGDLLRYDEPTAN